ncbi:alpha/beta hydrolase [Nocardia pseudovaccinii]|uniref:alpha/beta hydrolase n=1 Tax=Nocardia pseudovaccinii TaxID=189540 RepID=UPI0007A37FEB|nr:alpha/beta hydrolase [Nocardia pseudovaccinii]
MTLTEIDPSRFAIHDHYGRGFRQAFVREGVGGVPLLCIHGWPETKRIWWRVIEPLAAAGFEVIVPDLRGFGDSEIGPDGYHDVAAHSLDMHDLVRGLGHERVVVCAGDLGGPIAQDLALRFPDLVQRMVLFNCPLPYDRETMSHLRTRSPREARDYYLRQGTDADGLAAELDTPAKRCRYIATFYTSRFWAHPGAFIGDGESERVDISPIVQFHAAPFMDAAKLRASFGPYESVFSASARSAPTRLTRNPDVEVLVLFGVSDRVVAPDFDRIAALVFPRHLGPFLIRDCGHFVPWEAPHVVVSAARLLCRDLLEPGRASSGR